MAVPCGGGGGGPHGATPYGFTGGRVCEAAHRIQLCQHIIMQQCFPAIDLLASQETVFLERKTNRPICCPAGWLIPEKSAEFRESIC
jgi:hypothetical protein